MAGGSVGPLSCERKEEGHPVCVAIRGCIADWPSGFKLRWRRGRDENQENTSWKEVDFCP